MTATASCAAQRSVDVSDILKRIDEGGSDAIDEMTVAEIKVAVRLLWTERDEAQAEVERLKSDRRHHRADVMVRKNRDLRKEIDRLTIAEAEAMALVLSHEGTIERLTAEVERLELREGQIVAALADDLEAVHNLQCGDELPKQIEAMVSELSDFRARAAAFSAVKSERDDLRAENEKLKAQIEDDQLDAKAQIQVRDA
jgi:hypothetical protein